MEQAMAVQVSSSSQSPHPDQPVSEPDDQTLQSSSFWPSNGNNNNSNSGNSSQQATQDPADVLSESLAQVSLSPTSHSSSRSPVPSASLSVALTPGSVSSSYWSTATTVSDQTNESPFLNGSTYSPGYSSGGSSSGSPQSPLTRPTSRPITGGALKQQQQSPQIQSAGMCYPKSQTLGQPDKQMQAWKSGQAVWGSYSGLKQGPLVVHNMGQGVVNQQFGQKEKEWKDQRLNSSSQQQQQSYSQRQQQQPAHMPFASSAAYRQSLNSAVRPGSGPIGGGGRALVQQQQQQQQLQDQQQQQAHDMGWPVAPTGGGWSSSLNFHAARKFGRRRGNDYYLLILCVTRVTVHPSITFRSLDNYL